MSVPLIELQQCSKWYGSVIGINDVAWRFGGGIVGLLGPNGAGKSTLIKLIVGMLAPSRGQVQVLGGNPFAEPSIRAQIGYAPEHEKSYDELTGLEFVTAMARLSGVPRRATRDAAATALETMGMTKAMERRIKGYSKGMRQRTKLASAIVHQPRLLVLDEPLTGVDPMARIDIVDRIKGLAAQGTSVIISSHVLYEVEALTTEIVVIYRGQVLAEGNMFAIRTLIDKHPHRIRVETDQPRALAGALAQAPHVTRLIFEREALLIETRDPNACYDDLGQYITQHALSVRGLTSPDNNLGAVFAYLTGDAAHGQPT